MTQIRSNNLYISSQLHRWLKWMSDIKSEKDMPISADAVAEQILREHIAAMHPEIYKIEGEYWKARSELDDKAVNELKGTKK